MNFDQFSKIINREYDKLPKRFKKAFSRSQIIERSMRVGIESDFFNIDPFDWRFEKMVICTLRQDKINLFKRSEKQIELENVEEMPLSPKS